VKTNPVKLVVTDVFLVLLNTPVLIVPLTESVPQIVDVQLVLMMMVLMLNVSHVHTHVPNVTLPPPVLPVVVTEL